MAGVDERYVLARTFYWIAGGGATITMALAASVLAGTTDNGKQDTRLLGLEKAEAIRAQDHDKLVAIEKDVKANQKAIDRLQKSHDDSTRIILEAIKEKK